MQTTATKQTNLMEVFRLYPEAKVELKGKDLLDISYDIEARMTRLFRETLIASEQAHQDHLIDIKEAAHRLGVCVRTVDRMVDRGELEKVNVGGLVRFRESDIQNIVH